jgi:hypothetical protein
MVVRCTGVCKDVLNNQSQAVGMCPASRLRVRLTTPHRRSGPYLRASVNTVSKFRDPKNGKKGFHYLSDH